MKVTCVYNKQLLAHPTAWSDNGLSESLSYEYIISNFYKYTQHIANTAELYPNISKTKLTCNIESTKFEIHYIPIDLSLYSFSLHKF